MTEKIKVFTDGSSTVFKDNTGLKYGGVGVYVPKYPKCNLKISYKGPNVTNQRMELRACIKGIKSVYDYITKTFECKLWEIILYTDSMYIIDAITKYSSKWILYGWNRCINKKRKEIANLELIKELYTLYCTLPITFVHIKSHKAQPTKNTDAWDNWFGNKKVDEMSRKAMTAIRDAENKMNPIEEHIEDQEVEENDSKSD